MHSLVSQNPEMSEFTQELSEKMGKEANEELINRVATYAPNTPAQQIQVVIDEGAECVAAVTLSLDRYYSLNQVLQSLPEETRQSLVEGFARSLAGDDELAGARMLILEDIASAGSSVELRMDNTLQQLNIRLDQLPDIMSNSAVTNLLAIMADDPDKYKFQIGVLLSQIPIDKLPDPLTQKLKPTLTNLEFKINVGQGNWWLCGRAEPRLINCLRNGAAVLVNGFLLVKFEGKFSALCIRTTSIPNGQTFVEGNWYSPVSQDLKESVRRGFDDGRSSLAIPSGEWAMIRPLSRDLSSGLSPSEILEQAQRHASSMPDRLPDRINGMSRSDYRQRREEVHG